MSKEMCDYDDLDNRYEIFLQKLCQKLAFNCDVIKIRRPDLIRVNDFEAFYGDFTKTIEQIVRENQGDTILLNLSSGTPQMKSALKIVSTLSSYPLMQVQVSTPVKGANTDKPVGEEYDLELEWELNEDNHSETFENRCAISKSENLVAQISHEVISKHVMVYDYKAAITVAQSIKDFIDPRMNSLIYAGYHRKILDIGKAEMLARSAGYDLLPIKSKYYSEKAMVCFEFILLLEIKQKMGELADFTRAISPVLTDLFELYLMNKCGIDIEKYYSYEGKNKNHPKLSRKLLPPDLLKVLDDKFSWTDGYKDKEPSAANLYPLIEAKGESDAVDIAAKLREFEGKARNVAAHEIITVTEKWVKEKTGYYTDELLKMLKDFISLCISFPKEAWSSYDKLNEAIIQIPLIQ
jgi:hypothetical protein